MKRRIKVYTVSGIVLCAILLCIILVLMVTNNGNPNDKAVRDKNGRYIVVINQTEQVINKAYITDGEGMELGEAKINPDEASFPLKIPEDYSEYADFVVTLIDRYDLKYQKEVCDVAEKGITEVVITAEDQVKGEKDWIGAINRFFNGD